MSHQLPILVWVAMGFALAVLTAMTVELAVMTFLHLDVVSD